MPRKVRSARGEVIDFDAIRIKQQLAEAPMKIEVERRKEFIDSREGKVRGQRKTAAQATTQAQPPETTQEEPKEE